MKTAAFTNLRDLLPSIAEREHHATDSYPKESMQALYDAGVIIAPFSAEHSGAG